MVSKNIEAVKTEDKKLHNYELMFIISPEVAEDAMATVNNNITQFITGKNGVVSSIEPLGKKKLAYPIKRFLEGSYMLAKFKMDPAMSKDLETSLRISEQIIRFILVRLDN